MDEPKLQIGQSERENRPLKGLKDKGLIDFYCNDCKQKLLCLQLTSVKGQSGIEVLTRVVVECSSCGSYSDVKQVSGKFSPGAPSDDMAFDIEINEDNNPIEADVFFKAWKK